MSVVIPFPKIFGASDWGARVLVARFARTAPDGRTIAAFHVCTVDADGIPEATLWEGALYRDAIAAAETASKDWHRPIEVDIRQVRT